MAKILQSGIKNFNLKSNLDRINENQKYCDRENISVKNKSIFPLPLRKIVWKKINGKLVAEWIPTR
ncbi:MAG: hypothetical protein QNJ38_11785 [Prochloraceae cyanobacterium]|nr:hypothetical protein [Prochloraceae cyanobacterium]